MKKLAVLLFLCLPAFSQNVRYDSIAFGPKGPIANATIAVCTQPAVTSTQPCTPQAMLCSSLTDTVCNQPNPFFADALGNFHFYLAPVGTPITIQIYGPGVAIPLVLTDQLAGVGTSGGGGGVFPTSTLSPTSLAFGSIALGSTSVPLVVTLTNTGTPQVSISSIAITGDFAESTTCGSALAQASSCTISVTFSPTVTGARTGTLTITSNAASSPQTVSLSGTGLGTVGNPVTWSSAALSPLTPTITIPNTLQMTANYTPSAGSAVNGTNASYWSETGGGAGGSVTLVNHGLTQAGGGSAKSCPAFANVTSGDLLVMFVYMYNSGGVSGVTVETPSDTLTSTWTKLADNSGTAQRNFIAYTRAASTGADTLTITLNTAVSYLGIGCAEFSNIPVTPLDVSAAQAAPTSTASMLTPNLVTTGSADVCIGGFSDSSGGNMTAGTNWTLTDRDTGGVKGLLEYQLGLAAGTYQASATDGLATATWFAYGACFKSNTSSLPFANVSGTGLVTAVSAGTASIQAQGGTLVQSNSAVFNTAVSSATVVLPTAQVAGNTNAIKVSWGTATGTLNGVTDSAGNTYTCTTPEQANSLSVAWCYASPIAAFSNVNGNSITVTFGQATSGVDLIAEERNFTVASSVVDGSPVNATGASGAATASLTTVNATDVVLAGIAAAQQVQTAQAPFTVDHISANGDAILSAPATAAGSVTATAQLSGGAWAMQMLALKVVSNSTNATISSQAVTNVYYIAPANASPPGNDGNSCTQNAPCLTFTHILALLQANCPGANGCQVFLENGVYNTTNGTGFFAANCGTGGNAPNGTASAPIIIQAVNERQAWIQGSGSTPFRISNCSYWQVVGLHVSDVDNSTITGSGAGQAVIFINVQHNTYKRNLFDHNNRFGNNHVASIESGSCDNLISENEIYFYHRWGWMNYNNQCSSGHGNEFTRNYFNNRGYGDCAGCYPSGGVAIALGSYGSSFALYENNICEQGSQKCYAVDPISNTGQAASSNQFLGDVGLNVPYGIEWQPHTNTTGEFPSNNSAVNSLILNVTVAAFWSRNSVGTVFTNDTAVTTGSNSQAFVADSENLGDGGAFSSTVTNSIGYDNFGSAATTTGFLGVNGTGTWSFINGFSFDTPFNCTTVTCTNKSIIKPSADPCLAWVSTTSNMHAAGSAGADIGANILFEYSAGSLTATPLWSASAACKLGQTNCMVGTGAIVPGLNDVAGQSLFDVGTRLNINRNGCAYQTGYTPAP